MKMTLARIFRELTSRDREDGCATGQPQGVGAEAYLSSTSQGPTPEDAREDAHIRGRSRPFMIYAGYFYLNVFSFLFPSPMFQELPKKFMSSKGQRGLLTSLLRAEVCWSDGGVE